jgi:hypothetical protein
MPDCVDNKLFRVDMLLKARQRRMSAFPTLLMRALQAFMLFFEYCLYHAPEYIPHGDFFHVTGIYVPELFYVVCCFFSCGKPEKKNR